jgi:hemoglobin-like flavoprotein
MFLTLEPLETSFDLVAPRGDELVDTFYARLFAAAPSVQPLFAGTDLPEQKKMLLATLVLLRRSLRDLARCGRGGRGDARGRGGALSYVCCTV